MWQRKLLLIICFSFINITSSDLFNAISDLESFLVNEKQIVSLLENYVETEKSNNLELKK